jgi:hypothetical protein
MIFYGCQNEKTSDSAISVENAKPVINTDSLALIYWQSQLDSIQPFLDSLHDYFDLKSQNLNGRSYYHKNWYGAYSIADDALMSGVDSIGNFFMISNVRGGSEPYNHYGFELHVEDSIYHINHESSYLEMNDPMMLICACAWEVNFYQGEKVDELAKVISKSNDAHIKAKFLGTNRNKPFTIGQRDLAGIKDSYQLSLLIKDSLSFVSKIDSLNQILSGISQ